MQVPIIGAAESECLHGEFPNVFDLTRIPPTTHPKQSHVMIDTAPGISSAKYRVSRKCAE
jgi:hypothetical protein